MTLQQLFTEASSSCQAQHETGLAKGDACNASGTGGMATIMATRIDNGNVIAGDVFIEKAAKIVTGQITFINYTDGYFRVNGKAGTDTGGVMVSCSTIQIAVIPYNKDWGVSREAPTVVQILVLLWMAITTPTCFLPVIRCVFQVHKHALSLIPWV